MRNVFYRKLFSKLTFSILLSYIISELVFHSQLFFVYPLAFFGGVFLLIGWIEYLRIDGVIFFNSKAFTYAKKIFNFMDRFNYKNKGVYSMDHEPKEESETNNANTKTSIYANVACGLILLIGSQIFSP